MQDSPDNVFTDAGASAEAKQEVLDEILAQLRRRPSYRVEATMVQRPDGVRVPLAGDPLLNAARLVQEDLCLHEKRGGEHVLTAAVMCFPASWTLREKIGRPLSAVHWPVEEYDADVAKRVQRLFDGIRAGRPMWRFNVLEYVRPDFVSTTQRKPIRAVEMRIMAVARIFALSIKLLYVCRELARSCFQFIHI